MGQWDLRDGEADDKSDLWDPRLVHWFTEYVRLEVRAALQAGGIEKHADGAAVVDQLVSARKKYLWWQPYNAFRGNAYASGQWVVANERFRQDLSQLLDALQNPGLPGPYYRLWKYRVAIDKNGEPPQVIEEPPAYHLCIDTREFWRRRRAYQRSMKILCRDCAVEFQPGQGNRVRCPDCLTKRKEG